VATSASVCKNCARDIFLAVIHNRAIFEWQFSALTTKLLSTTYYNKAPEIQYFDNTNVTAESAVHLAWAERKRITYDYNTSYGNRPSFTGVLQVKCDWWTMTWAGCTMLTKWATSILEHIIIIDIVLIDYNFTVDRVFSDGTHRYGIPAPLFKTRNSFLMYIIHEKVISG